MFRADVLGATLYYKCIEIPLTGKRRFRIEVQKLIVFNREDVLFDLTRRAEK